MKKQNKKAKKKAIFKVFCNFYVEAKNIDKAEDLVLEECDYEFFEAHIIVKPGSCKNEHNPYK